MFYKHRYFLLDSDAGVVFDENGKRLAFTESLVRALRHLCELGRVETDELGDLIHEDETDRFYKHNTIRQYRYRINKLIGHDVVRYKDQHFFIDGEILKEESPSEWVVSEEDDRVVVKGVFPKKNIAIGVSIVLVLAVSTATYALYRRPSILSKPESDMVLIPEGKFIMGSTEEQAEAAYELNGENYEKESYFAEYPQREVNLPDYYIDRKEVSNAEFALFVAAAQRALPDTVSASQDLNAPNQPIVGVSWDDADAYCSWAGKRLPTEAEWEKAARGTDGRIFSWGDEWDSKKDNHGGSRLYRLDDGDGFAYTAPVGTELGVSPYGILNMSGNAYEWTGDDFNAYPENDKYSYVLLNKGAKVMKGGAFDDGPSEHRPASRIGYPKDFRGYDFGFRCAMDTD